MEIRLAQESDRQAWDDYVLAHPTGSAYHQYAWRQAVEKAYRFPGVYLMAVREHRICGVLPLIDFKIPFRGRSLISLPYCDVGGVLANDRETENALVGAAMQRGRETGCRGLTLRRAAEGDPGRSAFAPSAPKVRMLLALPDQAELLLAQFKSKLRSQIKKPLRDGLTAKISGLELVDQFYAIFSRNMRDIGSPVHSLSWVTAVVAAYGERARIGVVYTPDGSPAAAGVILLHNRTVSIPWASSLKMFNRLNANVLLYWRFLEFAIENGCDCFDFGRSTPGGGTYRFKQQWGARPHPLQWDDLLQPDGNPRGRNAAALRRFLVRGWQVLPVGFCSVVGPLLRRYISL